MRLGGFCGYVGGYVPMWGVAIWLCGSVAIMNFVRLGLSVDTYSCPFSLIEPSPPEGPYIYYYYYYYYPF